VSLWQVAEKAHFERERPNRTFVRPACFCHNFPSERAKRRHNMANQDGNELHRGWSITGMTK
jgi:hypothetical protein